MRDDDTIVETVTKYTEYQWPHVVSWEDAIPQIARAFRIMENIIKRYEGWSAECPNGAHEFINVGFSSISMACKHCGHKQHEA